jgi:hypothetical protein
MKQIRYCFRLPTDEDSPAQSGFDALASMRKCELGLRQRLRVLQIAKLKDWKVAFNLAKLQAGEDQADPLLQQAMKMAEDERKEREAKNSGPKMKRGRPGSAKDRSYNQRSYSSGPYVTKLYRSAVRRFHGG